MPDTSMLEKLNQKLEKSEKKLRKAINDEKVLQHQLKQLTRKERTHRLCTRGGMLESFLHKQFCNISNICVSNENYYEKKPSKLPFSSHRK